ncbi:radical SAM protein [Actinoplanes sp. NPDC023801]|uniref:radical SAM protein n=1 Tax=Actinoplanes sp. NPDC023801 TaxID=3154595 RepID=UPI0033DB7513
MQDTIAGPTGVIWDITYACPLRCTHCYSESGRRPSRQLGLADMLRVADALASLRPELVTLAGGEPTLVPGLDRVAQRFTAAGIPVGVYTSGWRLTPETAGSLARAFDVVTVSVDGATAAVHDRIRGRAGSFDRALAAAELLDTIAGRERAAGPARFRLGLDFVVTRGNFDQLDDFCTAVVPRLRHVDTVSFAAVVPTGLASRPGFAAAELLTEEQMAALSDGRLAQRLASLVPAGVTVTVGDNLELRMDPAGRAAHPGFRPLQVEPDGAVRAMPIYEGTVGDLRTEPAQELWRRAVRRWDDDFVVRTLAPVRTMAEWAEATRRLDRHFASPEVAARLIRRPDFVIPVAG